jgi:hypothetical protein
MKSFWVECEVDPEVLAEQLSTELRPDDLLGFILQIDAFTAETSFTEELIERLQESLEGEGG